MTDETQTPGNSQEQGESRGRPTHYTQDTADEICQRLSDGESLRSICRQESMPAESTVRLWALEDRNGFSAQYARAREIGYDRLGEELLEIADTPQLGVKTVTKATGTETIEGDMIEHRRLQVDARKWMLARMLPKKYGDRQAVDITDLTPKTQEEIDTRLAVLMAKAAKPAE